MGFFFNPSKIRRTIIDLSSFFVKKNWHFSRSKIEVSKMDFVPLFWDPQLVIRICKWSRVVGIGFRVSNLKDSPRSYCGPFAYNHTPPPPPQQHPLLAVRCHCWCSCGSQMSWSLAASVGRSKKHQDSGSPHNLSKSWSYQKKKRILQVDSIFDCLLHFHAPLDEGNMCSPSFTRMWIFRM